MVAQNGLGPLYYHKKVELFPHFSFLVSQIFGRWSFSEAFQHCTGAVFWGDLGLLRTGRGGNGSEVRKQPPRLSWKDSWVEAEIREKGGVPWPGSNFETAGTA